MPKHHVQGSTDAVTLEEPLMNGQTATFDWERQWYPLAFVEDLDPKVRHDDKFSESCTT